MGVAPSTPSGCFGRLGCFSHSKHTSDHQHRGKNETKSAGPLTKVCSVGRSFEKIIKALNNVTDKCVVQLSLN